MSGRKVVSVAQVDKKFPVVEIFGPTIQGEGVDQGIPCHFVRFGGCDFKCTWCDTPHAVLPEPVRLAPRLTVDDICLRLQSLHGAPDWVVLSGGNPALHELTNLINTLHSPDLKIAVETQATRFKQWLTTVDRLCLSPKPPSSGMIFDEDKFLQFLFKVGPAMLNTFIKVVVFDHSDYEFSRQLNKTVGEFYGYDHSPLPFFVSAGNDAGPTVGNPSRRDGRSLLQVREDLINQYLWLVNRVIIDKEMSNVVVQHQDHVIAWGNQLGH